jgi:hypothetical protein
MDWNRIEMKWHEMARRLQQGGPRIPSRLEAGIDRGAQDRPAASPDVTPDATGVGAPDETAARVTG